MTRIICFYSETEKAEPSCTTLFCRETSELALDIVLSRKSGLAWSLADCFRKGPKEDKLLSNIHTMTRDNKAGYNLKDTAFSLRSFDMEKMIDE